MTSGSGYWGHFFHGNGYQALAQAALGSGGVLIPGTVYKPRNVALGDTVGSECGAALMILKASSNLNDSMIFWVFHHTAVKENIFSWASWHVPGYLELC